MAKATRTSELVVKTIQESVPKIVLELTEQEAVTLLSVQQRVGGISSGRRGDMDKIGAALRGAGISPDTNAYSSTLYNGSVYLN